MIGQSKLSQKLDESQSKLMKIFFLLENGWGNVEKSYLQLLMRFNDVKIYCVLLKITKLTVIPKK